MCCREWGPETQILAAAGYGQARCSSSGTPASKSLKRAVSKVCKLGCGAVLVVHSQLGEVRFQLPAKPLWLGLQHPGGNRRWHSHGWTHTSTLKRERGITWCGAKPCASCPHVWLHSPLQCTHAHAHAH